MTDQITNAEQEIIYTHEDTEKTNIITIEGKKLTKLMIDNPSNVRLHIKILHSEINKISIFGHFMSLEIDNVESCAIDLYIKDSRNGVEIKNTKSLSFFILTHDRHEESKISSILIRGCKFKNTLIKNFKSPDCIISFSDFYKNADEPSITTCIDQLYVNNKNNFKTLNLYKCDIGKNRSEINGDSIYISKKTQLEDLIINDSNIINKIKIENYSGINQISFQRTKFYVIPDFRTSEFKNIPITDGMKIYHNPADDNEPETVPSRFRALRRMAVKAHDHLQEQDFVAGEIKAYRETGDNWRKAQWWFGWAYEIASDFGRSITRPIIMSTLLFLLSFNIHIFSRLTGSKPYSCSITLDGDPSATASALIIAAKNTFLSLGASAQKVEHFYQCLYGKNVPAGIVAWDMVHMTLSGTLIWLFIKGLMLHFKAK